MPFVKQASLRSNRSFLRRLQDQLASSMKSGLIDMANLGLIPRLFRQDVSSMFAQRFSGNVTIKPVSIESVMRDVTKVIRNPGKTEMEEYIRDGQRATWPAISYIKHLSSLEHALGAALLRLRRRVNEKYSKRARSRGSGRGRGATGGGPRSPRLTILSSSLQGMGGGGAGIALRLERTASKGNGDGEDGGNDDGGTNISPFTEHFLAAGAREFRPKRASNRDRIGTHRKIPVAYLYPRRLLQLLAQIPATSPRRSGSCASRCRQSKVVAAPVRRLTLGVALAAAAAAAAAPPAVAGAPRS